MRRFAAAALLLLLCACETREKQDAPDDWAEIEFRISKVHQDRYLLEQAPWHAPAGDWTIAECTLRDIPFLLGMEGKRGSSWGNGVIITLGDGEPFLKELSTAFDHPLPPRATNPQTLRPVIAKTAILGTDLAKQDNGFGGKGPWTATKWFYESRGRYAEVFVNVNFDRGIGTISEKDPVYREDLIRQLAWALRDGPPLPRTPANDPNLVENGPRFTNIRTIHNQLAQHIAFDSPAMFHLVYSADGEQSVVAIGNVSSPEKLVEIWKTKATPTGVSCRETQPVRCVVSEVISSVKGGYSSADPTKLWLITSGAPPVEITGAWDTKSVTLAEDALSPKGRFVGVYSLEKREKGGEFITHVQDLSSGKAMTYKLANDSIHLHAWEGDANILLSSGNSWDATHTLYRASVTSPALTKLHELDAFRSPDQTRAFSIDDSGKLTVRAAKDTRTFIFHADDAGLASSDTLRWLNSRSILFDGERPAFIDTDTMKMNYPASPEWNGGTVIASPEGRHALYFTGEKLYFADIQ